MKALILEEAAFDRAVDEMMAGLECDALRMQAQTSRSPYTDVEELFRRVNFVVRRFQQAIKDSRP